MSFALDDSACESRSAWWSAIFSVLRGTLRSLASCSPRSSLLNSMLCGVIQRPVENRYLVEPSVDIEVWTRRKRTENDVEI